MKHKFIGLAPCNVAVNGVDTTQSHEQCIKNNLIGSDYIPANHDPFKRRVRCFIRVS